MLPRSMDIDRDMVGPWQCKDPRYMLLDQFDIGYHFAVVVSSLGEEESGSARLLLLLQYGIMVFCGVLGGASLICKS
jgi:hypothetical protein